MARESTAYFKRFLASKNISWHSLSTYKPLIMWVLHISETFVSYSLIKFEFHCTTLAATDGTSMVLYNSFGGSSLNLVTAISRFNYGLREESPTIQLHWTIQALFQDLTVHFSSHCAVFFYASGLATQLHIPFKGANSNKIGVGVGVQVSPALQN